MAKQVMHVRLKPYEPRRGHVLRRYSYGGIKFHEERGWYRVDKDVADYLRTVRQVHGDEFSALAFDVCTEAEAQAIEAAETNDATVRRGVADAPLLPGRAPKAQEPKAPADPPSKVEKK